MNYPEVYEKWGTFPDCRIRIDVEGPENLWGKKLPDGLVGLNNSPLQWEYRLHDIVRPNGTGSPELVHRRWNEVVWFKYEPAETEEADLERRKEIVEALKPLSGHTSFWMPGQARIYLENGEGAVEAVASHLAELGFEVFEIEVLVDFPDLEEQLQEFGTLIYRMEIGAEVFWISAKGLTEAMSLAEKASLLEGMELEDDVVLKAITSEEAEDIVYRDDDCEDSCSLWEEYLRDPSPRYLAGTAF